MLRRVPHKVVLSSTLAAVALLLTTLVSAARPTPEPVAGLAERDPDVVALTNARIVVRPGEVIESGTLLIRGTTIEAVGEDVDVPIGARVRDLDGQTVYAGFIEPFSELPVRTENQPLPPSGYWNQYVTPHVSAADRVRPDSRLERTLRSQGIVARLAVPRESILKGRGAVVTTDGKPADESVMRRDHVLIARLTPSRGDWRTRTYPNSPMGAFALVRQAFHDAEWHAAALTAVDENGALPRPEDSPALTALHAHREAGLPVMIDAPSDLYALRAGRIAEEFGLNLVILDGGRSYQRAEDVAALSAPVVVPMDYPKPPNVSTPELADATTLRDLMHWDLAPENAGRLDRLGVKVSLTGHGLEKQSLFLKQMRETSERGLSEDATLAALTTNPAELLGVANRFGTIEPGKSASFVVMSGDLLDAKSKVMATWVEGQRFEVTPQPTLDATGTWTVTIDGQTYELNIKGRPGKLGGTLTPTTDADTTDDNTEPRPSGSGVGAADLDWGLRLAGRMRAAPAPLPDGRGSVLTSFGFSLLPPPPLPRQPVPPGDPTPPTPDEVPIDNDPKLPEVPRVPMPTTRPTDGEDATPPPPIPTTQGGPVTQPATQPATRPATKPASISAKNVTSEAGRIGFTFADDSGVTAVSFTVIDGKATGTARRPDGTAVPVTAEKIADIDAEPEAAEADDEVAADTPALPIDRNEPDSTEIEQGTTRPDVDPPKNTAADTTLEIADAPTTQPTNGTGHGGSFEPNYPLGAYGRTEPLETPEVFSINGVTLWTCGPEGKIENASVIIRDGKIERVLRTPLAPEDKRDENGHITGGGSLIYVNDDGRLAVDTTSSFIPHVVDADAVQIDGRGLHLTPGLIDAHSHIATDGGINESGQAVTCEVSIGDFVDPSSIHIYRQLAGGVTAANVLHGSANPIGGRNVVLKFRWGGGPDDLVMAEAPPGVKFALGENVKQSNWGSDFTTRYPQTRMGVQEIIADALRRGQQYAADVERGTTADGLPVRTDIELQALAEIASGERLIHCHSYRQDEILALLRVLEGFDIQIASLQHILEGYKVAPEMAEHGAMASTFSDWWAFKFEVYDAIPYNGALMHDAGIVVSFNSDDAELARRLNTEAAKAVKYGGVSEEEALKFVTLNPAKQLRIDEFVGSIEPGKQADLVLWSGHPLSSLSRAEMTFVDGQLMWSRERDEAARDENRRMKSALIQKVLTGGKSMAAPGERAEEEADRWATHDAFCHSHADHDGHDDHDDHGDHE
jgi:N-acetylglucosamine-6-phosphate deacetylase